MPLTDILNIAKLGLLANQGSLSVVSHNIANVNTPGFSKQSAQLSSVASSRGTTNAGGQGVVITQVRQQVDALVERRLTATSQELGRLEARNRYLPTVENAFNNMGGNGFGSQVDNFFSSADQLSNDATNPTARTQLIASGESLAQFASNTSSTLSETALPLDKEINVTLGDVNKQLQAIRDVNMEIIKQDVSNSPSLDLKDQRQTMINTLATKMNIISLDQGDGGITVMTSGGKTLVDHTYVATLSRGGTRTATGKDGIRIDNSTNDISGQINGGELLGLLEVRDNVINGTPAINGQTGVIYSLDKMVSEVRWQTNLISSQSVGKTLMTSQQGVFNLGTDMVSPMSDLDLAPTSASYSGGPPDMGRVKAGTVTIAYGTDMDNLTTTTIDIDPATQTIEDVRALLDASPAFSAAVNGQNHMALTAKASFYGVVSDTSGVMAGLGIGAFFGGKDALSMTVNPELSQPNAVGAAHITQDTDGSYHFDNGNTQGALALSGLRTALVDPFSNNEPATLSAHYGQIVGDLGSLVRQDDTAKTAAQSQQDFMSSLRDSASGVSLEEELTDLIKYQRAFQASGKMVSAADEMMQSVLQLAQ